MKEELYKHGVSYQELGGLDLLTKEVVADALAYLQLAVHPDDDAAFERICNKPCRRIGTPFSELLLHLHDYLV